MYAIYIFEVRYFCRLDPVTGQTVLNPYTPVEIRRFTDVLHDLYDALWPELPY